ncbi:Membrane protein involved in the export of O-antigen and teichoic acid [Granulicella pectinivorans]|uniref:Membrane protein involved in the export of O-antigen and teichoic acid n=1 Tax=Granulicella pectinivorans TaxID=474950 RepID=A0A1I6MM75_9BACT|nr:oligosaccharide flippase family protein [Granulicella pectinivorans]SFS16779.1 Membrane protein involved in the export of O-antigen and teichoic acid [Granulicella pectinivorans]
MISLRRFTGGVVIGWVSTFLSIAIGLFMSPFLIHHLGEAGYGVWVLVQSTVSYMYFMDLGLRTTVVRFTAKAQARGDHQEVSQVVSAALWLRLWTAAGVMAIALCLSALLPHIFHIPTQYETTARVALVLAATTLSSTLVFSVFTAVLSGIGYFDLLGLLEMVQVTLTSLGLIPILKSGHSIMAMAGWQLCIVLTINIVAAVACFRVCPELRIHLHRPPPELMRSLWSLGLWVLIGNGAGQLILYTDNVVVGIFVTASAVSYYAISAKMVEYVRQIAFSVLKFFMPLASSFRALDQFDRLRQLHVRGTQLVLLVTYPIVITLVIRGDTLLCLWIGDRFSVEATRVLQILAIAAALMLANASVNGIALALDRQKTLAIVTLAEGLANLLLSLILVKHIGVLGVAFGTMIPTIATSLFFWPRYLCKLVHMPTFVYVRDGWLRPVLAMLPFLFVSHWAEMHWQPAKLMGFVLQTMALLPLAVMGAFVVFHREIPKIRIIIAKRRGQAAVN